MAQQERRRRHGGGAFIGFVVGVGLAVAAVVTLLVLDVMVVRGAGRELPGALAAPTPVASAAASGEVPEPCLRAAEHNRTVSAALDDLGVGVRDQDARQVEEALDVIGDIRPEMDRVSIECQELAEAGKAEAGADDGATDDGGTDDGATDDGATDDGATDDEAGSEGATDADGDEPGASPTPTATP